MCRSDSRRLRLLFSKVVENVWRIVFQHVVSISDIFACNNEFVPSKYFSSIQLLVFFSN